MEFDWDLNCLDGDFEEKRKKIKNAVGEFVSKWKKNEKYTEDANVLKEALDDYENLAKFYLEGGDEYYFYWLKTQLDESNPELKAKFNKANEFRKEIGNKINFFAIKLSKIPTAKQKEFIKDKLLKDYKHFLENLFERGKYILDEKEEEIMSLKSSSSYSFWVDMLSGFLSREERIVLDENEKESEKNFSEIMILMKSPVKKIRETAVKNFNEIIKKYEDVAENEINAVLEHKKNNDKIRGYERPDKSRHIEDDIDSDVVDALIKSVSKNYDISNRYYKLKSKLLGIKKMKYPDRNIEYGKVSGNFDYKNSVELVRKVFSKLDKEFLKIFNSFINDKRIDVFPKKGKRSGAFCVSVLKSQPVFVMLNHSGKLREVLTIAHEIGHGINAELMKKQNSLNYETPKSTAEVASTFMEDFVLEELLKTATEEEKFYIMIQKLEDDIQTIIRQTACYKFEQELHKEFREKGYLSKDDVGKIFARHMKDYLGEAFEENDEMRNGWIYWPHIRDYFYVYSYASGLLISKAMQSMVKKDKSSTEKVKEFLSAGTSDSPKNIFMKMGIDITKKEFWDRGLEEVRNLLNETEKLAKKLGKI